MFSLFIRNHCWANKGNRMLSEVRAFSAIFPKENVTRLCIGRAAHCFYFQDKIRQVFWFSFTLSRKIRQMTFYLSQRIFEEEKTFAVHSFWISTVSHFMRKQWQNYSPLISQEPRNQLMSPSRQRNHSGYHNFQFQRCQELRNEFSVRTQEYYILRKLSWHLYVSMSLSNCAKIWIYAMT